MKNDFDLHFSLSTSVVLSEEVTFTKGGICKIRSGENTASVGGIRKEWLI
jgi:hypothetical protein